MFVGRPAVTLVLLLAAFLGVAPLRVCAQTDHARVLVAGELFHDHAHDGHAGDGHASSHAHACDHVHVCNHVHACSHVHACEGHASDGHARDGHACDGHACNHGDDHGRACDAQACEHGHDGDAHACPQGRAHGQAAHRDGQQGAPQDGDHCHCADAPLELSQEFAPVLLDAPAITFALPESCNAIAAAPAAISDAAPPREPPLLPALIGSTVLLR